MEATAILRYVRISPRKVKIVADLIRGKSIAEANAILAHTPKAASELVLKLLKIYCTMWIVMSKKHAKLSF